MSQAQGTPIPDRALKYLILGAIRGSVSTAAFPIFVDHCEENYDDEGQVKNFTIVTKSGLRFTVDVTFEEEE